MLNGWFDSRLPAKSVRNGTGFPASSTNRKFVICSLNRGSYGLGALERERIEDQKGIVLAVGPTNTPRYPVHRFRHCAAAGFNCPAVAAHYIFVHRVDMTARWSVVILVEDNLQPAGVEFLGRVLLSEPARN
jgi:hypothetical protein